MALEIGIVGLPNVGKSTLFNALAGTSVPCSNYPFCTVDANVGVVAVPDDRLARLGEMLKPEKLTPTTIRFVDIAGLTEGASRGEGLGNKFLANIRDVDAVVEVVRCFDAPAVSHMEGSIDPERDIGIIWTELLLADLETAERNLARQKKESAQGDKAARKLVPLLTRVRDGLNGGAGVLAQDLTPDEREAAGRYRFLTSKEMLYAANIGEEDVGEGERKWVEIIGRAAEGAGSRVVPICAELECEVTRLPADERLEFLVGLGQGESGLVRLVRTAYKALGLSTFFTIKGLEVRAWTVPKGTHVSEAAGKIHSDMKEGFIRADVISCEELADADSMQRARERGQVRTEGRDYEVRDGDVVLVHFH